MSLFTLTADISVEQNRSNTPISNVSNIASRNIASGPSHSTDNEDSHTPKRNACNTCRKRKLRCDGGSPACGRCTRLKHDCEYSERRRKSGPRRGYVKVLESRLAQVEGLLKDKDTREQSGEIKLQHPDTMHKREPKSEFEYNATFYSTSDFQPNIQTDEQDYFSTDHRASTDANPHWQPPMDNLSWGMIELGIDEPLPPQDIIDELTEVYFSKIHPSVPMIHQSRFLAAMNYGPHARPPVSLRYAMWAHAASVSVLYKDFQALFYSRARRYIEADERSVRPKYITIRHTQALILLSQYESKMMIWPTSWITTGRATRLAQMMNLHKLDGGRMEAKQALPVAMDWVELEERRRTFWMAFAMDRYGSSATGWPVIIDERDITSNLPASEEAFAQGAETPGICLRDAMENPLVANKISALGGIAIISSLTGMILAHLQRPSLDNDDGNPNGQFWKNHRRIDNILLNTYLCLPSHLRLPAGLSNSGTIFLNMALHAATICLHQDAIFKAETLELSAAILGESKGRCYTAATEICSVMKTLAHLDLTFLHAYTPFPLYTAARVFGNAWKGDLENDDAKSSLRFLLSALVAMKEHIPLAESYLIQLDLEGMGLTTMEGKAASYASVEKGLSEMSLRGASDETSWITYVSPMVRIVESSTSHSTPGQSASAPSPEQDKSKPSPNTSWPNQGGSSENVNSYFPDTQSQTTESTMTFDGFAAAENWDIGDLNSNLSSDLFDTGPGIDMSFWNDRAA